MSIGSWDPAGDAEAHSIHIEADVLARFIELSKTGQLDQLDQLIEGH